MKMPIRKIEIAQGVKEIEDAFDAFAGKPTLASMQAASEKFAASLPTDPVITVGRVPPPLGTLNKKTLAEMKVDYVPIDSVKLWTENPRKNEKAAPQLAELIKEHGIKSPLVVWRKDKTIYKGNTTYKALKLLGWQNVPVIFHDFPSKAAATAYGIADNKASEYAGWDTEILAGIMRSESFTAHTKTREGLKAATGFSERSIAKLFEDKSERDISDLVSGKFPFVVVEFQGKDEYTEFKKKVSADKVIPFAKLNAGMGYYAD